VKKVWALIIASMALGISLGSLLSNILRSTPCQ
jgi:hypothetical protein